MAISEVAYVLGMSSSRLNIWYKNSLSGCKQMKERGELRKNDIKAKNGKFSIKVPVLKKENIGQYIEIDDKHIDGKYNTILRNILM